MAHWDFSWDFAMRLGLALVVGSILGLNRWLHHKSAGMRTHALVSIGAATALMLNSQIPNYDAQAVSHVLQGLITGLGFLGAGVIIQEGTSQKIHGLTTAASIWSCALIGAAFGAGEFAVGFLSLGAILLALLLGGPCERLARKLTGSKLGSEIPPEQEGS
ncbi:MgtC/SapB family protein [Polynucleobacter paludilacus]|uniref:MgtC/SapB family protein n=1 Tax=Polynucleobacter paludilacus TaxID=1855895 RepID=UPI001BFE38AF|nr:MgtC/SapB family protein [Polynucleobacter paludilacus]QWD86393.1 MgtC/SapB family protein [Polynucleobacter paludilacus]